MKRRWTRPPTVQKLFDSAVRLSTQIYVAVSIAVLTIMFASGLGIFFVLQIGEAQRKVNEENVPRMVAAFEVAVRTEALTAVAPRLAAASAEDVGEISAEVAAVLSNFKSAIAEFRQAYEGEIDVTLLRSSEAEIEHNIGQVEKLVSQRTTLREQIDLLRAEFQQTRGKLALYLGAAADNQLFYLKTGYRELGEPPASRARYFNEAEFERYRLLAELSKFAEEMIQQIASGFAIKDEALLSPLVEEFEASLAGAQRVVNLVGAETKELDEVIGKIDRLASLGIGDQSGFSMHGARLRIDRDIQDLLLRNRREGNQLVSGVKQLVASASTASEEAAAFAGNVVLTATWVMFVLNGLSIVGALLLAWLFVERRLVRRLLSVSQSMREMALGDLDVKVQVEGRDEIAEMATALEVFRQHAREHLRLNLVEKMAAQLQEKNQALEEAMQRVREAQDQMVMQQKLAALGELTAGVAHEIKNPMNFILNFAEVSQELLGELLEEIDSGDRDAEKDRRDGKDIDFGLVEEIGSDLTTNMTKIQEHSQRANSVVKGMLAMGRGTGEATATDINSLLDESVRLAFHSARAADQAFMADIQQDLAPETGTLLVKPQDIGRAFINVIGNACMAVDEKRVQLADQRSEDDRYEPTLTVSSRREGEKVRVTIRDNGIGMSQEVMDKMFNPFFTTKPTTKGTGLGMSLTLDILREHGGTIHVESKAGEFTEIVMELSDYPDDPGGAQAEEQEAP